MGWAANRSLKENAGKVKACGLHNPPATTHTGQGNDNVPCHITWSGVGNQNTYSYPDLWTIMGKEGTRIPHPHP